MTTTQCLVHHPGGRTELQDCRLGPVGQSQCLVETTYSAVSPGTELRCLFHRTSGSSPFVPGYLGVGRIIEAGPLSRFSEGERVFFGGAGGYEGLTSQWGCHSRLAIVDDPALYRLPAEVSDLEAVFSKLAAIALHGVNLAGVEKGNRVLVLGLGILGQLSARLASLNEAHVLALGRNPNRVEKAVHSGIRAHEVDGRIDEMMKRLFGPGIRADVILDVTGNPQVINETLPLAHDLLPWERPATRATRYVVQGSFHGNATVPYEAAFTKELHLFFARDHTRKDLEDVLSLMASGKLSVQDLVPDPVSPAEAYSHYEALHAPTPRSLTAVFDWSKL